NRHPGKHQKRRCSGALQNASPISLSSRAKRNISEYWSPERVERNDPRFFASLRMTSCPDFAHLTPTHLFTITKACRLDRLQLTAEISPGTLLNFLAADVRDQKCVPRAVWLLCNPRRTFPGERRDYRCNAVPSLQGFSDQQVNLTACRRDARQ